MHQKNAHCVVERMRIVVSKSKRVSTNAHFNRIKDQDASPMFVSDSASVSPLDLKNNVVTDFIYSHKYG